MKWGDLEVKLLGERRQLDSDSSNLQPDNT